MRVNPTTRIVAIPSEECYIIRMMSWTPRSSDARLCSGMVTAEYGPLTRRCHIGSPQVWQVPSHRRMKHYHGGVSKIQKAKESFIRSSQRLMSVSRPIILRKGEQSTRPQTIRLLIVPLILYLPIKCLLDNNCIRWKALP